MLADILIAYLERQLCLVSALGLPPDPPRDTTIATFQPFSSLIEVAFPFDVKQVKSAPDPSDERYDRIAHEMRHFAGPPSPYAVPVTPLFQHLELVVNPAKPDPDNAEYILGLIQPKPFCADANDPVSPMKPAISEGWRPYAWHNEKHYWVSDMPGARLRVDIKVHAGRCVATTPARDWRVDFVLAESRSTISAAKSMTSATRDAGSTTMRPEQYNCPAIGSGMSTWRGEREVLCTEDTQN